MLLRKLNVYGIVLAPQAGGYPLANMGAAPPHALEEVMLMLAFFVHLICMSGEIEALVVPDIDGSILKVNIPGDCETAHMLITEPLTLPSGIFALIDPPPPNIQLMVIFISALFV